MLEMMGNEGQSISPQSSGRGYAKILFVALALFLMFLSGVCGYLIGVKTARHIPTPATHSPTPTPTILLHCLGGCSMPSAGVVQTTLLPAVPCMGTCPKPSGATHPTIPPVTPPYPIPSPDLATADWQTYTSPDYGFSFRYPPEWTIAVTDYPPDIRITIMNSVEPKRYPMQVAVWTDERNTQTVSEWFQANQNGSSQRLPFTLPPQQITIGGYTAIRTRQTPDFEDDLAVSPTHTTLTALYQMSITGTGEGDDQPYAETEPFAQQEIANFHSMLSTFRFPQQ